MLGFLSINWWEDVWKMSIEQQDFRTSVQLYWTFPNLVTTALSYLYGITSNIYSPRALTAFITYRNLHKERVKNLRQKTRIIIPYSFYLNLETNNANIYRFAFVRMWYRLVPIQGSTVILNVHILSHGTQISNF